MSWYNDEYSMPQHKGRIVRVQHHDAWLYRCEYHGNGYKTHGQWFRRMPQAVSELKRMCEAHAMCEEAS